MAQQGKRLMTWFDGPEVAEINKFRRRQEEIPSLAAAIRMLVQFGIESEKRAAKRDPKKADTDAVCAPHQDGTTIGNQPSPDVSLKSDGNER
jgi:hypothetical protein